MLSHYILYPPFYTFSLIMPTFFKYYSKLFSVVIFWVSEWTSLYWIVWTSLWNIWLSKETFLFIEFHSLYPIQTTDSLPLCQWSLTLEAYEAFRGASKKQWSPNFTPSDFDLTDRSPEPTPSLSCLPTHYTLTVYKSQVQLFLASFRPLLPSLQCSCLFLTEIATPTYLLWPYAPVCLD